MARRTGRGDATIPNEELLAILRDIRRKIEGIEARATINGPLYRACEEARHAIDGVVEVVTGDREALWTKLRH